MKMWFYKHIIITERFATKKNLSIQMSCLPETIIEGATFLTN